MAANVIAQDGPRALIEAFPAVDGSDPAIAGIIDRVGATGASVTGLAAIDRDFLDVLSRRIPVVLALMMGLTLILLAFAFRSIVLPLKAVALNLMSLAAAFGVIVIVFQQGHGSALWDVQASGSVTAWVPVMVFAFLFGLSMDYEVFMLSRMREAYDETGSTSRAHRARPRAHRQARHQRRADPRVRVPRPLHQPGLRDQAAGDRRRRGHHPRCHDRPRAARPRADAPDGRGQLVDAAPTSPAAGRGGRRALGAS